MKERHRQEVRRSLNNSPFLENQNATKSSPSMPLIFSVEDSPPLSSARPLVQSQSFTSNAQSPINHIPKRPLVNIVRSTSTANDIYGNNSGASTNQTQQEVNIHHRYSAPLQPRNGQVLSTTKPGYIQNVPLFTSAPYQVQESTLVTSEEVFPLNRSVSAYSGFPQQTLLQQQFQHQQQQINMQQQIYQQQQQQQLQQKIQLQIEHQQMQQQLEQQQIQYQLDQKQLQLQEQQRIQQYQLQQLKIQQQQQQYINQAILEKPLIRRDNPPKAIVTELDEDMKPLKSRPLYERLTVYDENHSTDQIATPDTPPPESQQNSSEIVLAKEILLSNSSTSTLTEPKAIFKPKEKTIKLPNKLKKELQEMQLRRSPYSLPDLSTLSNTEQEQENDDIINWNTIQIFHYPYVTNSEETCYTQENQTPKIDCYPAIVKCCSMQDRRHTCSKRHHCTHLSCINTKHPNYSTDSSNLYYKKHHSKHRHHRCHKKDSYSKTVQV
ncbi:uncharacterized protein EV154DRAFT_499485 [Mucor mucedo]|uniref:uncharacterized protein n=1 Tax=Mucor mucedo TaxID=29922 RepID=UPI00221E90F2|nr:uncharacterized protein EV154DRAFT_499485 [Mucor mucedo]KAI7894150.1 hypothetical protein EV154DRAFT_499485 [Mucor mucedo]